VEWEATMKLKTLVLMISVLCLTGTKAAAVPMDMPGMDMGVGSNDVAVHGMFAFGEKTLYLSHLPMFSAPHDEQAIFEALFDSKGMTAYAFAKKSNPDQMVTIVPEPFSLLAMIAHPASFKADLYMGHFERGGQKIASGIKVKIVKVVHAHHLGEPSPDSEKEIHFGEPGEMYEAHFISAAPDFDQIDRITSDSKSMTIYHEEDDLKN
jgi:hypothetical protein